MHLYEQEIQLNGRNGVVVNAVASIHPEHDAQIPERVIEELWTIIKAANLEEAISIPSIESAVSPAMTPQLVSNRILQAELDFYCPLYAGEDVYASESLYVGGSKVTVHIRLKEPGDD